MLELAPVRTAAVAVDAGLALLSADKPPYQGHRENHPVLKNVLDGDPKQLAVRKIAGMEADISQTKGIPVSAVATADGVKIGSLSNDLASLDRLKRDRASIPAPLPGPKFNTP